MDNTTLLGEDSFTKTLAKQAAGVGVVSAAMTVGMVGGLVVVGKILEWNGKRKTK